MEPIKIMVCGTSAVVVDAPPITVGMVGCPVEFSFDDSWDGLTKSALYRAGSVCRMDPMIETISTVAAEVLTQEGLALEIGLLGTNSAGTIIIPTVWVSVDHIQKSTSNAAQEAAKPELPVWQTVLVKLNDLIEGNLSVVPKNLIVIGETAPKYGPVLWYDTSVDMKGTLRYVDENNQIHDMMPRTTFDMIQGSEEMEAHLKNTQNPHGVTSEQIFAAGPAILSPHQLGDTLPEPGIPGRIFFKKKVVG